jgi:capsular exopolysaccharide synthesis family protein
MDIRHYWRLLKKWSWLLAVGGLVAGGMAYGVNRNRTPVYQAGTTLLITPGSAPSLDNYNALGAAERLARTYAELLCSGPVVEETERRLGELAGTDPALADEGLAFQASAQPLSDTQLLGVRVTGTDPQRIAAAADLLVEVFGAWLRDVQQSRYGDLRAGLEAEMQRVRAGIEETEAAIGALQGEGEAAGGGGLAWLEERLTQYRSSYTTLLNSYSNISLAEASSGDTVTVVSRAEVPQTPIRPQVGRNSLLAAVAGVLFAAGLAFLAEYLDETVKTPDDAQEAGLGVLVAVPRAAGNHGRPQELLALTQMHSPAAEAYRTLRTNLQFSALDRPLRCLVVTSALAREGKTTTAANLAAVVAQAGKRVVLVDADLRRPAVHRFFDLPNRGGLTDALLGEPAALAGFLRDTAVEGLRVLTSGPLPPNPQELLGSQRMEELLQRLQAEADVVVMDTSPCLVVADANVLAARADGVLLVVNAGRTRRPAVGQATDGLRQVGVPVVGGVLNMVDVSAGDGAGYYSHQGHDYSDHYGLGGRGGRWAWARWRAKKRG